MIKDRIRIILDTDVELLYEILDSFQKRIALTKYNLKKAVAPTDKEYGKDGGNKEEYAFSFRLKILINCSIELEAYIDELKESLISEINQPGE